MNQHFLILYTDKYSSLLMLPSGKNRQLRVEFIKTYNAQLFKTFGCVFIQTKYNYGNSINISLEALSLDGPFKNTYSITIPCKNQTIIVELVKLFLLPIFSWTLCYARRLKINILLKLG